MASPVAAPLERQFGQIAGITQMTSISTARLDDDRACNSTLNRNIDGAAQDVQGAITAAESNCRFNLFPPRPTRK